MAAHTHVGTVLEGERFPRRGNDRLAGNNGLSGRRGIGKGSEGGQQCAPTRLQCEDGITSTCKRPWRQPMMTLATGQSRFN